MSRVKGRRIVTQTTRLAALHNCAQIIEVGFAVSVVVVVVVVLGALRLSSTWLKLGVCRSVLVAWWVGCAALGLGLKALELGT